MRNLKRLIHQKRNLCSAMSAIVFLVVFKLLTVMFKDIVVGSVPFSPQGFIKNFITYNLSQDLLVSQEECPVGACFLFALIYISIKPMLRKVIFNNAIRLTNSNRVSIPSRVLFSLDEQMHWTNYVMNCFGLVMSMFFSGYKLYKALKKYKNVKYVVSITRNVSRITGWVCSLYIPVPIRYVMYGGFAKFYGIDMEEVVYPDFGHYETFTKFFTRNLKPGARKIEEPTNKKTMCSPCDGRVLTCGAINSQFSTIDCVKGRSYRLDEFMLGVKGNTMTCDQTEETENNSEIAAMLDKVKERGNQLFYMVIYLSPADYHRFHSPAIHTGDYRRHVVGYLSPVKPSHVNKHKDVFKNNERVNIFGRWAQGFYFESAVGATNVGSIKLDFDEEVETNQFLPQYPYFEDKSYMSGVSAEKASPFYQYLGQQDFDQKNTSSINFEKAEMTGRFEMGSTIVLVFEADKQTSLNVHEGKKLFVGEPIVTRQES